jgi:hypothetical protein
LRLLLLCCSIVRIPSGHGTDTRVVHICRASGSTDMPKQQQMMSFTHRLGRLRCVQSLAKHCCNCLCGRDLYCTDNWI